MDFFLRGFKNLNLNEKQLYSSTPKGWGLSKLGTFNFPKSQSECFFSLHLKKHD